MWLKWQQNVASWFQNNDIYPPFNFRAYIVLYFFPFICLYTCISNRIQYSRHVPVRDIEYTTHSHDPRNPGIKILLCSTTSWKASIMGAKKYIVVFVIPFLVGVGYPPMLTPDAAEARSLVACLFAYSLRSVLIMAVHLRRWGGFWAQLWVRNRY